MARIKKKKEIDRKEVITLAAARLFREKGFNATGMRDVAGDVGVEAASLYNHIRSKAELLQSICFRIAQEFTTQLDELDKDGTMDSLQKLESVIRFHIRMWVERPDEVLVANNESKYLNDPFYESFLNERRIYVRRLEAIIEEGIRNDLIRETEPYVVVLTLLSAVRGIEFWHRTKKHVSAEQLESNMVSMLVQGLRVRKNQRS
jgi:AcrR family transcriptional regulator